MKQDQLLIFDLDGTLSDPAVGIWRSINYALAAFDYPAVGEQAVSQHWPTLDVAFRRIVPMETDATILGMVAKYRERYGEVGYAENVVYAGIPDALASLASDGVPMGVCTSKRADVAERILALFDLRRYFDFVSGGDVGVGKDDQLRVLLEHGTAEHRSCDDRRPGGRCDRGPCRRAAVDRGHGSLQELRDAAPDRLLEVPDDLTRLVDAV
ncbi:MAG: HAD hydrolase-like protein [Vicinamibacterales bacterium]